VANESVERRAGVRVDVCGLGDRFRCRILPGEEVRLVDVSAGGLLVETQLPLAPGRVISLQVAGRICSEEALPAGRSRGMASPCTVAGRVIRCAVTALSAMRGPLFRAGIAILDRDGVPQTLWSQARPIGIDFGFTAAARLPGVTHE
jgi:hypothetical protein